jgi:hypothetical protein
MFMSAGERQSKDYTKELQPVLDIAWPPPVSQSFISVPYPYPPAVFPIVSAVVHSELLKAEDVQSACQWFAEAVQAAPLSVASTNEKRFVTFLMIYILAGALQPVFEFNDVAVVVFQCVFKPVVDAALIQYARPFINRLDGHLNRFATACFDLNGLLADAQKTFGDIRTGISFPASIKTFTLRALIAIIDARTANKILANPARFTFGNAAIWGSFLTAFQTEIGHSMPIAAEVASGIQMAPAICADPKMTDDVCPHLKKPLVFFLLTNVRPDEMMAENIDASKFVTDFGIDPTAPEETVTPKLPGDYKELAASIRIADWNACDIQPDLIAQFPFLREFMADH